MWVRIRSFVGGNAVDTGMVPRSARASGPKGKSMASKGGDQARRDVGSVSDDACESSPGREEL